MESIFCQVFWVYFWFLLGLKEEEVDDLQIFIFSSRLLESLEHEPFHHAVHRFAKNSTNVTGPCDLFYG